MLSGALLGSLNRYYRVSFCCTREHDDCRGRERSLFTIFLGHLHVIRNDSSAGKGLCALGVNGMAGEICGLLAARFFYIMNRR